MTASEVAAPPAAGAATAAAGEEAFVFPLSLAQERLWFVDQMSPGLAAYNIPLAVRLCGRLDRAALAAALAGVVRRHETLRTRFGVDDGQPVQVIAPETAAPPAAAAGAAVLPEVDLRALGAAKAAAEAARLAAAAAAAPFDLPRGPVWRARLLRTAAAEHVLLLVLHHIAGDRWSLGVLLAEVAALYVGRPLPPLPLQYADFAVWQREALAGGELGRQLAHWRERLAGAAPLVLPADWRRPARARHRGAVVRGDLPPALADALRQRGREAGATLFMTLLAGFVVVLAQHAGEDDLVVGTAVAGRARRELEGLIGFFVNTLPLRVDLAGEPTFGELVARVRAVALDAFAHQDVPFDRLVEEMRPSGGLGGGGAAPPLVQVTFLLQNTPLPELRLPGVELAEMSLPSRFAKFDLAVSAVEEAGGGVSVHWELDADLFLPAGVERLARQFRTLLAAAVAAPHLAVWDLPLADQAETAALLAAWNRDLRLPVGVAPPLSAPSAPSAVSETEELASWLCTAAATAAGVAAARVAPDMPWSRLALDSLAAVELRHEIAAHTGVEVELADLLDAASADHLAAAILARQQEERSGAAPSTAAMAGVAAVATAAWPEPSPPGSELPLAAGQRALWLIHQLAPASGAYHIAAAFRVLAPLDDAALRRAVATIARRHAALRSTFHARGGEPYQTIQPEMPPEWREIDATGLALAGLGERLADEAWRPFDLARGPLVRLVWLRGAAGGDRLLFVVHHLVADFTSLAVAAAELGALYGLAAPPPPPPPPPAVSYEQFVRWQAAALAGERLERLWAFWSAALAGAPAALDLPADRPRPPAPSYRGGVERARLPGGAGSLALLAGAGAGAGAGERAATPFVALAAAWMGLLHRTTGDEDLLVGTATAGRPGPRAAAVVGYFANPVVLRARPRGDQPFSALLAELRETTLAAFAHQDLPFPLLAERLHPERDAARSPVFQVSLALYREPGGAAAPAALAAISGIAGIAAGAPDVPLDLGGLRLASLALDERWAPFDLSLRAAEVAGDLVLALQFSRDLFDAVTARRLLDHLVRLLAAAAARPASRLAELPLLAAAERWQLLGEWAETATATARAVGLPHLVAEQAARTPDAVAVVATAGRHLSYGELDRRAAGLARRLAAHGVGLDSRVGLHGERSPELVIGALGILRTGAAFVPLDPELPPARLAFQLGDAVGAGGVVLAADAPAGPPWDAMRVLPLALRADGSAGAPGAGEVPPDGLAYVLYTSGSTGTPKGVMNSHRGIVNRLLWGKTVFPLTAADRVAQKTPATFDVAVVELFSPLVQGACLVQARAGGHREPAYLARWLVEQAITVAHFVPSLVLELLAERALPRAGALRRLLVGGEAMARQLALGVEQRLAARLYNLYGPAEAAVDTVTWPCRDQAAARPVPLGWPVANTRAYVVEHGGEPAPLGIAGELWLGGPQLGRGYLGRPALTAERFVPDPWAAAAGTAGARAYRTGDRVRRRWDGALEFLGRLDFQVKVRGVRIELGEIEAALVAQPEIAAAAVRLAGEAATARLVAFVVAARGASVPAAAELRRRLRQTLPDAMLPARCVTLAALPLTPHGKRDHAALALLAAAPARPAGDAGDVFEGGEGGAAWEAPRGAVEELLAALYAELLPDLAPGEIGRDANFFALGGHSLLAARLAARAGQALGCELPLAAVWSAATLADLARAAAALRAAGVAELAPLVPVPREGELPLSFAQERLWFIDRLEPATAHYNLAAALAVHGALDRRALARAVAALAVRHEVLRARFPAPLGRPVQAIAATPAAAPLPLVDLAALPPAARAAELDRRMRDEARRPFDLARGPLLRCLLLHAAPGEHRLLVTLHHIVADGWSVGILERELGDLYAAGAGSRTPPLPVLPLQYADFAVWQRRSLTDAVAAGEAAWWRERLAAAPADLALPFDRPRPAVPRRYGASVPVALPPAVAATVGEWARRQRLTPFMALLAALQALLARYSGQPAIAVGAPVAGRQRAELEPLVGCFVNTLVLVGEVDDDPPFADLLTRTRQAVLAALAHQELPFERLVELLAPERRVGRQPFFQVLLAVEDARPAGLTLAGLRVARLPPAHVTAKADLALTVAGDTAGFRGALDYDRELFDPPTAARLAAHWTTLIAAAAAHPGRRLSELPLLSPGERAQVVGEWNDTAPAAADAAHAANAANPADSAAWLPVPAQVAARARRAPDAAALVQAGRVVSYGALYAAASSLAARLRACGVGPETTVALCAERSAELAVGLLAVLLAGGAFVPLDPAQPAARLGRLLSDARPRAVLTRRGLRDRLPPACDAPVIELDAVLAPQDVARPDAPPAPLAPADAEPAATPAAAPPAAPGQLAYVIYTSGSTGQPKGVEVSHAAFANLVAWHRRAWALAAGTQASWLSGVGFDASVWELWPALAAGGTLHLPDDATRLAPEALRDWLVARQVGIAFAPTALAAALVESPWPRATALAVLLTGGDRLAARPPAGLPFALINNYGPTEGTVVATAGRVPPRTVAAPAPPTIGRPIRGVAVRLLDPALRPVPIGVAGELCIAGLGLARGYRGRPELTAGRFVPDPLGSAGARLYRSGDLGRWLAAGEIEFLGRRDQQIKLRGHRIEPAEIEAVLTAHPAVRQAVVLAVGEGGARRLVASVEGVQGAVSAADLRAHLRAALPEAMVPARLVFVERLPLTVNGKLDRRAVAVEHAAALAVTGGGGGGADQAAAAGADGTGGAPRGPVEELLAGVWADLLGIEAAAIGRQADFFALGGHSLLATRLAALVERAIGVEMPLAAVFAAPTLAGLAARIAAAHDATLPPLPPLPALPPLIAAGRGGPREEGGELAAAFAQERMWLLDRLAPASGAYHIATALAAAGALDVAALRSALDAFAGRHETLRTTFAERDGRLLQVIAPPSAQALPVIDLTAATAGAAAELHRLVRAEAARPFDLARGPLLRVTLVRRGTRDQVLLVTLHHIIADAASVAVMLRELGVLYDAAQARGADHGGVVPVLAPLPIQYADYALWQRGWLRGELLAGEVAWWRERLAGLPPELPLPWDRPRPAVPRRAAHLARRPLAAAAALAALARAHGATLFMTLLAAFQVLLARLGGGDDVPVGTPVANRTRPEVEGLVGLFVNTLVLRGDLAAAPAFDAFLARTRDAALAAYAHQEVPIEKLVEALAPVRDAGRQPLFQVLFTLEEAPLAGLRLGGVALAPLAAAPAPAKFDLTLAVTRQGGELTATLELDGDRFDAATGELLADCFATLVAGIAGIAGIAAAPAPGVDALPLLDTAARRAVLAAAEGERVRRPARGLHELFEAQAARTPDAVALVDADRHLTYQALDEWGNLLAHRLARVGVGADARVGICAERSAAMSAALLAVLKAGGAFVPLDPDHPPERLAGEIAESEARVVLVTAAVAARLPRLPAGTVVLRIAAPPPSPASERAALPRRAALPAALAYVIFTSGSTGRPKGVMVSHGAILNHELFVAERYPLNAGDTALQITPFSFDAALWELFTPLAAGARLVVARPGGHRDPSYITRLAAAEGATVLQLVPSMAAPLLDDPGIAACRALRLVACGGEPLPGELADRLMARLGVALVNFYGPTECAIDATSWPCRPGEGRRRVVPIGLALPNVRAHVLDDGLAPLPVGAPGELCVGGACLARGYVGRPELTAERFVPDPWSARPGERLYRTGDRVRRLRGGEIEYLGRRDAQVKVRGARVELGEIEAVLLAMPGVSEAAVVMAGDQDARRLVACVVPAAGAAGDDGGGGGGGRPGELAAALRRHCREQLPEYMLPQAFVVLARLPRLPSGKLDRRAAAAAAAGAVADESAASADGAPHTPYEEIVAGLWAEVLGRQRVGVEADFFADLGGHSLLAAQVVSRMRERLGVEVPLRALFDAPTVRGLAAVALRTSEMAATAAIAVPLLARRAGEEPAALSFAQERIWFLTQLTPGLTAYNMPLALTLHGDLAVPALARALAALTARHEVLRTRYAALGGPPVQVVAPAAPVPLPVVDLGGLAGVAGGAAAEAARLAAAEARRAFDLGRDLPLRACLLRLGGGEHRLLLTLHHIAADGWSLALVAGELGPLYAGAALATLPLQYADYAAWQRRAMSGAALARQLDYWRRQLAELPPLELPADRPRPAVPRQRGAVLPWRLPAELGDRLRQLAREAGATLFMTLLAGFQELLARHAGQDDFAVGAAVANRGRREIEGLVGLFVNTLALRTGAGGDGAAGFAARVAATRETTLAAYAHQDVPFERLVEELQPARDTRRAPLVQVMLLWQNTPLPALALPGLAASAAAIDNGSAKLDLLLSLEDEAGAVAGAWEVDTDLFDVATIARFAERFRCLLAAAAAEPRRPLAELRWFDEAERREMLAAGQAAPAAWQAERPVRALVAEQAARAPEAVAVTAAGERALSYGALDAAAARLAGVLRRRGVGPEVRVGVCLDRGPELLVALLAVLEAGGAYVPLDPAHPPARLAAAIADAAPRLVLAARRHRALLAGAAVYDIEEALAAPGGAPLSTAAAGAAPADRCLDGAAYVIFTSGSTGRPKGVVVTHRGLSNLLLAIRDLGAVVPGEALLAVTTLGFDIAGLELFVPLVTGGTVALAAREESAEPARLRARLADPRIAAMQATPATWHMLLDDGWRPRRGFHVLCGGEALPAALAAALLAPGAALWNLYGPTETTIWSTALRVAPHVPRGAIVPLGAPLAHTTLRVLDGGGEPVPLGVAGELHIGGAGVARGYLDRPDLTAERFVPDAWGAAGARLYRTGDRVCRRSSGALEFLGRLDHQVKLRGFRIEPAEIAAVLRDSPGIGEAVVVLREDVPGGPRLVAYVVPAAPAGAGKVPAAPADTAAAELAAALRRRCRERLPAQMVPAAFVVLPRLPLTPNGKLDRRALPAPAAPASPAAGERGSAAAVAATPLEEIVAGLWADVLGRERVGIEDDFFTDLGGHSLLATQVVARLRERLGYELPLRSLFEAPTVRAWAGRVAAAAEVGEDAALAAAPPRLERRPKAAPGEPPAPLPLSFAQERLWFLEQLAPGLPVYNLPLAVRLSGPLDRAALARALAAVVARHEALRTRFRFAGGRPVQEVAPALAIDLPGAPLLALPLVDLTGVAAPAGATASATAPGTAAALSMPASTVAARLAAAEAARPFDLEMAPLLRATLVALAAGEHLLLLTLHHIAGDGWSFGVLLRELGALYAGRVLPELPVQYADYALWQRRWLRGAVLDGQLAFWRRQLAELPVLDMPADRPRPPAQAHRGGQVPIAAPAALLPALRQLGRAAGATLFMTLLAGFQALLARWSGQRDLAVGTAVANRRRRELEELIGFFANTLVLRADLAAAADFAALLAQVRATTLDAYAHQDVPFEKLVEQLRPTRDTGRNPLVQVMLVLQNAPLAVPPLPGLTAAAAAVAGHGAMFDLSLLLTEDVDGGLRGVLEYDADLWDAATAERLADHFLRLLAAAAAATEGATAPLADLPLLSPGELRQVVEEWNRTAREPRPAATLHARVAAQARRTPAAVAVVHGGRRLTYGELADAAGVLAGRLRRAGAGAGRIVAVSLERSAEMVVALLGVLAAGAAYVPLDPAYPAERRAWVLGDAGAALGVTSTRLQAQVAGDSAVVRWLCVDQPEEEAVAGPGGAAAVASAALAAAMASAASGWRETDPSELAYVIYTSGSTGRPKGVAIAHESASALLDWSAATFPDAALAGVLASTSISFDLSIFELFGTLARGGTVVLAETLFDEAAWDCGWPVTLVNTVPSLLDSLLAGRPLPASVQVVNLAGEALPARLVERLRAALPDAVVMNLYGPSEATTYSTWARVGGEPVPPIGRPVAGTWGYVLDGAMAPQPVGVPGELYLGGAGLARGYLGRPELTAERFLPDPFGDQRGKTGWGGQGSRGGERLYRTGDRVRWLRGGVLEYLGRLDDQVKLRGFRIEPGEVEAALAGHPAVREAAVVVVRQDAAGERRLVAYVALAEAGERAAAAGAAGNGNAAGASAGDAAAAELRRYCRERLPAHLVPAAFVMLPRLPLTASGKLDRRALPAPEAPEAALAGQFVAPRNELERTVAAIWQEVLGVERVGTRDNFFDLGGHSLLLVSLRDRLRQRLGRDFTLVDLFRHPTVAAFVDALAQPVAAELPRGDIATRAAQREAAMRDRRSFRPGSKGGR